MVEKHFTHVIEKIFASLQEAVKPIVTCSTGDTLKLTFGPLKEFERASQKVLND